VDFRDGDNNPNDFLWALGDKRYERTPFDFKTIGKFDSFVRYLSTSPTIPPYIIFPRELKSGRVKYPAQVYYRTTGDRMDCQWARPIFQVGTANWELEYSWTKVKTPAYRGRVIKVRFKEDFLDKGWLEDWYFAENIGPVKIETFSQGQKLVANMPVMQRLELKSYYIKTRGGKIKKRR
jgi:hypothetical protein